MSNLQVNNYGFNSASAASDTSSASSLDTTDFLKLLATQMANQDVMNPTDNTEFVAQMAQFSTLQMMENLNQYASLQYSASLSAYSADLVGKNVLLGTYDDKGNYVEKSGVVDSVSYGSGTYSLKVDGKDYELSSVMEILSELPAADPPAGDGSDSTGDSASTDGSGSSDTGATDPPAAT